MNRPTGLDASLVTELSLNGPFMQVYAKEASLTGDGVHAAPPQERMVVMTVDQFERFDAHFDQHEKTGLILFLKHMRRVDSPTGPKMTVPGFSVKWLKAMGMPDYRAKQAISGLKGRGIIVQEDFPTGPVGQAGAVSLSVLEGGLCGIASTPDKAPGQPTIREPETGTIPAVDNPGYSAFRKPGTGTNPVVDNPHLPETGNRNIDPPNPAIRDTAFRKPETGPDLHGHAPSRVPHAGVGAPTSGSSVSKNIYNYSQDNHTSATSPVDPLVALLCSPGTRSALTTRPDETLAAFTRRLGATPDNGNTARRAEGMLAFFGVPPDPTPIHALAVFVLSLTATDGADMVAVQSSVTDRFHQPGWRVNIKHPPPARELLATVALAVLAGLDTDVKSLPGWFGGAFTRSRPWRPGPSIAALTATITDMKALPQPVPGKYAVADLSDPGYRALMDDVRTVLWQCGNRDAETWESWQVVMASPHRQQWAIRLYEEWRLDDSMRRREGVPPDLHRGGQSVA